MVMLGPAGLETQLENYETSLLANWSAERLGIYEGQWIAWTGDVIDQSNELAVLLARFRDERPLFAFVSFKVRA